MGWCFVVEGKGWKKSIVVDIELTKASGNI